MSLTNVTEDLSGLSRAELVYKAKLAEQAERCVRPLLVSISAFPPSRVACGRRTEENLSVWRAGPYILRSDRGSGEPSARPRSHGTTLVAFASPSPAAPRIEPRARLAGPDLARDHTVSSRIARIVNSNRDTSSSAAHGDDAGGLARGRRARYPRSRSRHSHEAALSPAEARQPPPAAEFDTARRCPLAAPLDWAHGDQSTRVTSVSFRVFFVRVVFLVVVVVVVRFRPSRLTDSPTPPDHTLVVISTSRTSLSNKQLRRDDGVHVQGG
jgi:hypothetical protein